MNERVGRSLEVSSDEFLVVESDGEGESFRVSRVLGVDLVGGSKESNVIRRDEEVDATERGREKKEEKERRSACSSPSFLSVLVALLSP